jgi:SAM-dependent methyltransferase
LSIFQQNREALALQRREYVTGLRNTIQRRFKRMRRRRKVGRAYDMALEIARAIPRDADVLDVGCGNGFIAHHLTGLLGKPVVGLDVGDSTTARIKYLPFDGRHFPVRDQSFDAVLLCYVLHHAQDAPLVLNEVSRVLRDDGLAIIYEDMPLLWWDRLVCWTHDRQWRGRTGSCTFQREQGWRKTFRLAGLEIVSERPLSRWRNLAHPVARRFFVLRSAGQALLPDPEEARMPVLLKPDHAALPQVLDHAQAIRLAKGTD